MRFENLRFESHRRRARIESQISNFRSHLTQIEEVCVPRRPGAFLLFRFPKGVDCSPVIRIRIKKNSREKNKMSDRSDNTISISRRQLLGGLTGAIADSVTVRASLCHPSRRSKLRLGGPIFLKSDDPAELARGHRVLGYSAAYCPPAKVSESERVKEIERALLISATLSTVPSAITAIPRSSMRFSANSAAGSVLATRKTCTAKTSISPRRYRVAAVSIIALISQISWRFPPKRRSCWNT